MAKKTWWKSSKGQAAIREAARADAAGAMRVGPAASGSGGGASLGNTLGMRALRGPLADYQSKVISQGPSTGFGSFKTGTDVNQYGRAAVVKDEALF